jgi:hypothetical protein
MTNTQAATLRVTGKQRVDPRPCEHLSLKLERDDSGFFTGNYQCIVCGESPALKHQ